MTKKVTDNSCFLLDSAMMDATVQQARNWREYPVLWPLVHEMFTQWLWDNAPETANRTEMTGYSLPKPLKKAELDYESSMDKYWKQFEDDWVRALKGE